MILFFGILLFCTSNLIALQNSKTIDTAAPEEKIAASAEQEHAYLTWKGNEQLFELMSDFCHKKQRFFRLSKNSVLLTHQPVMSANAEHLFFLQSIRKLHTREIEADKQFSSTIIHQYLYHYSVSKEKLHHYDLYDHNFFHGGFCHLSISPSNHYVLIMARNRAVAPLLWNVKKKLGTPLEIFNNQTVFQHAAWSPNSNHIAFIIEKNSGENHHTAFAIYDREQKKSRCFYENLYEMRHGIFTSIAWSFNGAMIVGATKDGMLYIHHAVSETFSKKALEKNATQLCWAPDNAHVAGVSEDNKNILIMNVWAKEVKSFPADKTEQPFIIQWHSPRELCVLAQNYLIIWDIKQEKEYIYRWKSMRPETQRSYLHWLIARQKLYRVSDAELCIGTVPRADLFKLTQLQISLIKTLLNTHAGKTKAEEYQAALQGLALPELWKQIILEHLQARETPTQKLITPSRKENEKC